MCGAEELIRRLLRAAQRLAVLTAFGMLLNDMAAPDARDLPTAWAGQATPPHWRARLLSRLGRLARHRIRCLQGRARRRRRTGAPGFSAAWDASLDTEFVAFRVGEHDPSGAVGLTPVVDHSRAQLHDAAHLRVPLLWAGRREIQMDTVLDLLGFGHPDEQQAGRSIGREQQALGILRVVGVTWVLGEPGDP